MFALLCLHGLLLGPMGVPPSGEPEPDLRARALEIQLRGVPALLELDAGQREALALAAERAAAAREGILEEWRSVLRIQGGAFTAFREQDLEGGAFEPDTELSAARANALGQMARTRMVEAVAAARTPFLERLDPGQLLLLEVLGPDDLARCVVAPPTRAPGEPLLRKAWSLLGGMQGRSGPRAERAARSGAAELVELAEREGAPAWSPAAEGDRIAGILERAASLSDTALERCRGELSRVLLPRTRERHLKSELDRIHAEHDPRLGTLGRLLLLEGAASVLRGEEGAWVRPAPADVLALEGEIAALRNDINLLNLINGLHLGRDQLRALAAVGEEAAPGGWEVAPAPDLFASVGLRPPSGRGEPESARKRLSLGRELTRICRELGRGRVPRGGAGRRVQELVAPRPTPDPRRTGPGAGERLARLLAILSPVQRHVLHDYNTCLIPPRDLRDPVRVGQADAGGFEARLLELARSRPPGHYARRRLSIADDILAGIERRDGAFPGGERERIVEELAQLFDEVRSLDDVAFAVQAPELALRLRGFLQRTKLKEELGRSAGSGRLEARARRFLLDPRFPKLAREIVARREERGLPDPVDLATISPAPSCDEGSCAVD